MKRTIEDLTQNFEKLEEQRERALSILGKLSRDLNDLLRDQPYTDLDRPVDRTVLETDLNNMIRLVEKFPTEYDYGKECEYIEQGREMQEYRLNIVYRYIKEAFGPRSYPGSILQDILRDLS
jgi:predicted translin family RNA/ssDNA-binding protein